MSKFNKVINDFILMQAKYLQKIEREKAMQRNTIDFKPHEDSDEAEPDLPEDHLFISPLTGQPIPVERNVKLSLVGIEISPTLRKAYSTVGKCGNERQSYLVETV